ncbi:MAG: SRPBCC family protein [Pseudomonadota bacterium]
MVQTVQLIHDYPYPASRVWQVVTDLDRLREVTAGLLAFRNLPSGQIRAGQVLEVEVSLFGRLPYQPYRMEVEALDAAAMTFQSDETGAGVETWRHHLRVVPTATGCRVEERIEIAAWFATPIFALWARGLYRARHKPRLQILAASTEADKA